jgi:Uncharacterized alpha/beta hydrolase domain (DUF2235)
MSKKRLVVCFDGTWNAADSGSAETNVARIRRAVRANSGEDKVQQICFYEKGVGTSGNKAIDLVAGATGLGVGENVRSAYINLAQNYVPGDDIFLFGFSRGAFSARSLAGLIGACGLLKRQSIDKVHKAWEFYRGASVRNPAEFKLRNDVQLHDNVTIKFLGVWDTVGALGVPVGAIGSALSSEFFQFHDTRPSKIVEFASHALAIDEKRDEFVPTLWTGNAPEGRVIEQVWFAGCHSDVGGGYTDRGLADIPLRWMAKRAELQGLALDWGSGALPQQDAALDALAPMHESRDGYSLKDRLTPTIRSVCGLETVVEAWEKLYSPRENGKPVKAVNQYIHSSVIERYAKVDALTSVKDKIGMAKRKVYDPINLKSAFSKSGEFKQTIPVHNDGDAPLIRGRPNS